MKKTDRRYIYSEKSIAAAWAGISGIPFLCIGLTALEVIMEILMPFVTAIIIDRGLEAGNLPVVYRYGALMVLMSFLSLTFGRSGRKERGQRRFWSVGKSA